MGEECSSCKLCSEQDEIRAEPTSMINNIPLTNKANQEINKHQSLKTSQKSTNQSVASQISNNDNNNNNTNENKKIKYKRKEGRKSTLDSIKFNDKNKSDFEE